MRRVINGKPSGCGGSLLPLTPALSPRERENHIPRGSEPTRGHEPTGIRWTNGQTALPPLPLGEGRGEGERSRRIGSAGLLGGGADLRSAGAGLLWRPGPTLAQHGGATQPGARGSATGRPEVCSTSTRQGIGVTERGAGGSATGRPEVCPTSTRRGIGLTETGAGGSVTGRPEVCPTSGRVYE